MEEKPSFLEKLNDKVLKSLLKYLNTDGPWEDIDEEFMRACDSIVKMTGFAETANSSDVSFLFELIQLNDEISADLPLKRPNFGLFEVDWSIYETRWVKETYRHKVGSYSKTGYDVREILTQLRMLVYFEPWDGDIIDEETYDSEMTEEKIDSVRQIK